MKTIEKELRAVKAELKAAKEELDSLKKEKRTDYVVWREISRLGKTFKVGVIEACATYFKLEEGIFPVIEIHDGCADYHIMLSEYAKHLSKQEEKLADEKLAIAKAVHHLSGQEDKFILLRDESYAIEEALLKEEQASKITKKH